MLENRKHMREAARRNRLARVRLQRMIAVLAVILVAVLVLAVSLNRKPTEGPDGSWTLGKFTVTLCGGRTVTHEYGTAFSDPGILAVYDGTQVQAQVQVQQPELNQLGDHTISYTVTYGKTTLCIERTVTVVDTQPPVLELVYIPGHFTEIGATYQDEGCTATDNFDGDISDRITAVNDGTTVTYTVTDSSGNTASVQRTIQYGDSVAPEITLLGEETVTLMAGCAYTEPGYTAMDDVDGDLTASVTVSGEYDIYLPGTYTLTYTVSDGHGNEAIVNRQLVVSGLTQPDTVDPGDKVIYLTFDDGPSEHTPRLLEILEKYNVKATFFVVGTSRLEYLDDIAAAGHSIGIHTDTHRYDLIYTGEEAFFADFYAVREKIYDRTGLWTTLCRFPGGSSNMISKNYCVGIMTRLTQAVEAQGYQYFDWNVDSGDAGGTKTAQGVYENVIAGIRKSRPNVVLQHDIFDYSVDAVEKIIQWGLANGYTFLALEPSSPTAHHPVNN